MHAGYTNGVATITTDQIHDPASRYEHQLSSGVLMEQQFSYTDNDVYVGVLFYLPCTEFLGWMADDTTIVRTYNSATCSYLRQCISQMQSSGSESSSRSHGDVDLSLVADCLLNLFTQERNRFQPPRSLLVAPCQPLGSYFSGGILRPACEVLLSQHTQPAACVDAWLLPPSVHPWIMKEP